MINDTGQFHIQNTQPLGAFGDLNIHQFFHRQRVAVIVAHGRDVIEAIRVRHVHDERVTLANLLMITVQITHNRLQTNNGFTIPQTDTNQQTDKQRDSTYS